jgi:hypothetical protein
MITKIKTSINSTNATINPVFPLKKVLNLSNADVVDINEDVGLDCLTFEKTFDILGAEGVGGVINVTVFEAFITFL